jgi:hypothetical protein
MDPFILGGQCNAPELLLLLIFNPYIWVFILAGWEGF